MDLDGSGHGVVSGKKGVRGATHLGSWLKDCPRDSSALLSFWAPSSAASWGSPMQMQPLASERAEAELTVKELNSSGVGNGGGDSWVEAIRSVFCDLVG